MTRSRPKAGFWSTIWGFSLNDVIPDKRSADRGPFWSVAPMPTRSPLYVSRRFTSAGMTGVCFAERTSWIAFGDHSAHAKAGFNHEVPVQTPQGTLRLRPLTRLNWRASHQGKAVCLRQSRASSEASLDGLKQTRSQSSRALGQAQPAPKGIQDRFSSIFFVPFQQLTQNKIGPF
jgi:hypothetical protein